MNRFIDSTRLAEEILGRPATLQEIWVTLEDVYGKTLNNIYEMGACMFSLLREDLIFSDLHSYRYTVHKQEGYYNYSEIFRLRFKEGYACDSMGRVIATTAQRVNLTYLTDVLTSKDEALFT